MRVCFDHQIFWLQRSGGISRYFCELAGALYLQGECEPVIVAAYHRNRFLAEIESQPYVRTWGGLKKKLFYNRFWDGRQTANMAWSRRHGSGAIMHETYYTQNTAKSSPRVTTVHDMIYEKFNKGTAGEHELIEQKRRSMERADAVIAVSQSTRNDIVELYPHLEKKTRVVYHGVSAFPPPAKLILPKPFILFVGNRGWYKNGDELYRVYRDTNKINQEFDLVYFGGEEPSQEEKKRQGVIFLRGDDSMLRALYENASVLAYTSAYEGFGMPVLEAMSLGCPVICCSGSSLPEVAGDAAILVGPGDREELSEAFMTVLADRSVANELRTKGKERASLFTWKKCAEETLRVYKSVF